MSVEGLWTIQFAKSEEEYGGLQVEEQLDRGGIFVLSGNRLLGGGLSFYFVGTYSASGSNIEITLNATRYNDLVSGQFGVLDEARLLFKGTINGNSMTLQGHVEDKPDSKMIIKAEHRT